ncbi:hypothetical protein [Moraxella canis]|uniref:Uncharacterized protein n=1 Tax=Moraxella canis TaxID=90239 RepID=A0A1S9ZH49_9GAMM|nr:hypothetical protein [Moraxella canis]OOR82849.1 hypothetical protein B0180_08155 [Moraxella canis]
MIIKDYTMGTVFTNQDLMDTFKVSNSGGMRRSKAAASIALKIGMDQHALGCRLCNDYRLDR